MSTIVMTVVLVWKLKRWMVICLSRVYRWRGESRTDWRTKGLQHSLKTRAKSHCATINRQSSGIVGNVGNFSVVSIPMALESLVWSWAQVVVWVSKRFSPCSPPPGFPSTFTNLQLGELVPVKVCNGLVSPSRLYSYDMKSNLQWSPTDTGFCIPETHTNSSHCIVHDSSQR